MHAEAWGRPDAVSWPQRLESRPPQWDPCGGPRGSGLAGSCSQALLLLLRPRQPPELQECSSSAVVQGVIWGARRMMNGEGIPGPAPGLVELFKNAFSHVNFCSINPDDMSNIAIVS